MGFKNATFKNVPCLKRNPKEALLSSSKNMLKTKILKLLDTGLFYLKKTLQFYERFCSD